LSTDKKIRIAFYKGPGLLRDRFIRRYTNSKYSHTELVLPDGRWIGIRPPFYSSVSIRAGLDPKRRRDWDFIDITISERKFHDIMKFFYATELQGYDWVGMSLSHLTGFKVKRTGKWYCSEWVAYALEVSGVVSWDTFGLYDRREIPPGKLYDLLDANKNKNRKNKPDNITNFASKRISGLLGKAIGLKNKSR
jgi:hypothetical protein